MHAIKSTEFSNFVHGHIGHLVGYDLDRQRRRSTFQQSRQFIARAGEPRPNVVHACNCDNQLCRLRHFTVLAQAVGIIGVVGKLLMQSNHLLTAAEPFLGKREIAVQLEYVLVSFFRSLPLFVRFESSSFILECDDTVESQALVDLQQTISRLRRIWSQLLGHSKCGTRGEIVFAGKRRQAFTHTRIECHLPNRVVDSLEAIGCDPPLWIDFDRARKCIACCIEFELALQLESLVGQGQHLVQVLRTCEPGLRWRMIRGYRNGQLKQAQRFLRIAILERDIGARERFRKYLVHAI